MKSAYGTHLARGFLDGGVHDLVWRGLLLLLLSLAVLATNLLTAGRLSPRDASLEQERDQRLARHFSINVNAQAVGDTLVLLMIAAHNGRSDPLFDWFIVWFCGILSIVAVQWWRTSTGRDGMGTDVYFSLLVVLDCFGSLAGFLDQQMKTG